MVENIRNENSTITQYQVQYSDHCVWQRQWNYSYLIFIFFYETVLKCLRKQLKSTLFMNQLKFTTELKSTVTS